MRTGRSEAVDLFRKWFEDKRFVRCEGSFRMFAFSLAGRIVEVRDDELRLMADDLSSELNVKITPDLEFQYADSRQVTGTEGKYESVIGIFFGPVPPVGSADTITLAVLQPNLDDDSES